MRTATWKLNAYDNGCKCDVCTINRAQNAAFNRKLSNNTAFQLVLRRWNCCRTGRLATGSDNVEAAWAKAGDTGRRWMYGTAHKMSQYHPLAQNELTETVIAWGHSCDAEFARLKRAAAKRKAARKLVAKKPAKKVARKAVRRGR